MTDFETEANGLKNEAAQKFSGDLDNLKQSFGQLRTDVMKIVRDAMGVGRDGADSLKDQAGSAVHDVKDRLNRLKDQGANQLNAVEHKIEENPIPSALIAFGVGFIVAKLLTRR